jgi:hypothetical protein
VSPAKRGDAQRSMERSDLDAPAAGYTVLSESALARFLAAFAVFAALIHCGVAHLLLRLDPKREPVFRMQP